MDYRYGHNQDKGYTGQAGALAGTLLGIAILAVGVYFYFWFGRNQPLTSKADDINFLTEANTNIPTSNNTNQPSEMQGEILQPGTGEAAKTGDVVEVNYIGWLTNGTKFDSSYDHGQTFSFTLGAGQVIQGWDMGVAGMKVGEKRRLTIPPKLAYGEQGAGSAIPPNATLIFEIELIKIK